MRQSARCTRDYRISRQILEELPFEGIGFEGTAPWRDHRDAQKSRSRVARNIIASRSLDNSGWRLKAPRRSRCVAAHAIRSARACRATLNSIRTRWLIVSRLSRGRSRKCLVNGNRERILLPASPSVFMDIVRKILGRRRDIFYHRMQIASCPAFKRVAQRRPSVLLKYGKSDENYVRAFLLRTFFRENSSVQGMAILYTISVNIRALSNRAQCLANLHKLCARKFIPPPTNGYIPVYVWCTLVDRSKQRD